MNKSYRILILFILCVFITSCKDFQSNDLVFNQTDWKKLNLRVRGRMVSNLLARKLLIGKTRNEVLEMLGNPDEEYKDFIKYAIDFGFILEGKVQRNFLMIVFDEETQIVKKLELMDS